MHVFYRGTAIAIQNVMSGQLPLMVADTAGGLAQIRAGKVRVLAVLSSTRIAQLPRYRRWPSPACRSLRPIYKKQSLAEIKTISYLGCHEKNEL
ncbi:tripartite tricarboxylate transporter substrate-binding protein [Polaromonas sp.]|uniref:tripartite tricarboxylate transporter substrate-binding protein n=1 Tax=Polaromonas sp. TaxID=1869339 RepID=UPI0017A96182|nr:hypothetical protein [Polaromonas sp.]